MVLNNVLINKLYARCKSNAKLDQKKEENISNDGALGLGSELRLLGKFKHV